MLNLREIEIAKHYGKETQLQKLKEECLELAEAIDEGNPNHISEEKADVQITLDETEFLDEDSEKVNFFIDAKLNRQIGRIENEKQQ